jgi:hypothetical protein
MNSWPRASRQEPRYSSQVGVGTLPAGRRPQDDGSTLSAVLGPLPVSTYSRLALATIPHRSESVPHELGPGAVHEVGQEGSHDR